MSRNKKVYFYGLLYRTQKSIYNQYCRNLQTITVRFGCLHRQRPLGSMSIVMNKYIILYLSALFCRYNYWYPQDLRISWSMLPPKKVSHMMQGQMCITLYICTNKFKAIGYFWFYFRWLSSCCIKNYDYNAQTVSTEPI